jgi:hypothetical protein
MSRGARTRAYAAARACGRTWGGQLILGQEAEMHDLLTGRTVVLIAMLTAVALIAAFAAAREKR